MPPGSSWWRPPTAITAGPWRAWPACRGSAPPSSCRAAPFPARIAAIESEGATVEVVDGSYDDAVRLSAEMAGPKRLVLSDTSWPGYEDVPRWVIEGYATIFEEVDAQSGGEVPGLAVVPIGVGALAAATARRLSAPLAPRGRGAERRGLHARVRARRSHDRGAGTARLDHGRAERRGALPGGLAVGEGRVDVLCAVDDDARGGRYADAGRTRPGGRQCSGGSVGATVAADGRPAGRERRSASMGATRCS